MTFTPFGSVDDHERKLRGLECATVGYRLGVADSFHEERSATPGSTTFGIVSNPILDRDFRTERDGPHLRPPRP